MSEFFELPFAVLKVKGNVEKLFGGISTNTLESSRNAFLDVYGKIVVAFYQQKLGEEIIIGFNEKYLEKLEKHWRMHLKLGQCEAEKTQLKSYFFTTKVEGAIGEKNGSVLFSESRPEGKELSREEFDCWRVNNGISLQGEDFENEMVMNTDWKDAVSFDKGCFLGQEIVAKINYRGKPPKRLAIREFEKKPESAGTCCFYGKWKCFVFEANE